MKKSFKNVDSTVVDVPAEVATPPAQEQVDPTAVAALVAANAPQTPAVADSYFSNDGMEGEFNAKDVTIPRLNLTQAVGPLTAILNEETRKPLFTAGDFAFNRSRNLGGGPLEFTLLRLRKYYAEDLPYVENGPKPRIFNSENDVRRSGGFMSWEKKQYGDAQDYYKPVLDATILLRGLPDYDDFPFEFNGIPYAKAMWTLQSTAYSRAGKQLITQTQLGLRNGLYSAPWRLSASREKIGANWVWVPNVRLGPKHSTEFVDFAKQYL